MRNREVVYTIEIQWKYHFLQIIEAKLKGFIKTYQKL